MDQIQETVHPLSAAAAPVANYNIQPVAKMPPQMDKKLINKVNEIQNFSIS
jgi:hypothetical protein